MGIQPDNAIYHSIKNDLICNQIMICNVIIKPNYKRPFAAFIKKVNKALRLAIEDAVLQILDSPSLGEQKSGDLKSIYVYKFRFNRQEYLIVYKFGTSENLITLVWIDFYQVGSHENFYEELKRYLREST